MDRKCSERLFPSHSPRVYGENETGMTAPLLSIMEHSPSKLCPKDLRKQIGDSKLVWTINKINKGNRQATTIGLFPHALRQLTVASGFDPDDLSRSVIRACAARFREYLRLGQVPETCRVGAGKPNHHRCLDPFHYLDVIKGKLRSRVTCQCDIIDSNTRKRRRKQKRDSMHADPRQRSIDQHLGKTKCGEAGKREDSQS